MSTLRNHGRILVPVIESADTGGLDMLQTLMKVTAEFVQRLGLDVSKWPDHVADVWPEAPEHAKVLQRLDNYGDIHTFVVLPFDDHDLLLSVSSRRDYNAPEDRSGNLAVNTLLDILQPPPRHPGRTKAPLAPYGHIYSYYSSRLWRTRPGAAHLQELCEEYGIGITAPRFTFDPSDPGSMLVAAFVAEKDRQDAETFVTESTLHRRVAHESGITQFARSKTHPALRVDRETRHLSWDLEVVHVLREVADVLARGGDWFDAADAYAGAIPNYTLREEPDYRRSRDRRRSTSRAERNVLRTRRRAAALPLKYLKDGQTPNPDYRPETYADLEDPASALRKLFQGPSLARQVRRVADGHSVDVDFEGIPAKRLYLDFLFSGRYRRVHRDPENSSRSHSSFRLIAFNLPRVDDHYALTPNQHVAVRDVLNARGRSRTSSRYPLSGLFTVHEPGEELHADRGRIRAKDGALKFRTGHNTQVQDGYRIYFEPFDARGHGRDCQIAAWMPADELHASVADAIIKALDTADVPMSVTPAVDAAMPKWQLAELERAQANAKADFDEKTDAVLIPALSPRQRERAQYKADEAERCLEQAESAVKAARAAMATRARDVLIPLKILPSVLAALSLGTRLPEDIARQCRQQLSVVLHRPTLRLDPASASVVWSAQLVLETLDGGTLRAELRGTVRNRGRDTWLAGPGGMFWTGMSFHTAWRQLGMATPVGAATRWQEPIIDRLCSTDEPGLPVRDAAAARLLVKCPHAPVVRVAMQIRHGQAAAARSVAHAAAHEAFFDPDGWTIGPRDLWRSIRCHELAETIRKTEPRT